MLLQLAATTRTFFTLTCLHFFRSVFNMINRFFISVYIVCVKTNEEFMQSEIKVNKTTPLNLNVWPFESMTSRVIKIST